MQQFVSLKPYTRLKVGGVAKYFSLVTNIAELLDTIRFINDNHLSWYVIGYGSNIIVNDTIFDGVVIKLTGEFTEIDLQKNAVRCGAGFSLIKLGHILAGQGFSGYEYMAVIPGSVGGAVRMNAGTTKHGVTSDHFFGATAIDPDKEIVIEYSLQDMAFANRFSALQNSNHIILNAEFKLDHSCKTSPENVRYAISKIWKDRLSKQPHVSRTFGSIFKRPLKKKPAGWYLEKVDMIGLKVGNAMVTYEHANWIVNLGNASAFEVKKLIDIGQQRVWDAFGIKLEREVVFLPEDILK